MGHWSRSRSFLLTAVFALAATSWGQQPNSLEAGMTFNGVDNGSYPIAVNLAIPTVMTLDVTGAPGEPFLIYAGHLDLPGEDYGAVGRFDLHQGADLVLLVNGIAPVTPADQNAVIPSSGHFIQFLPLNLEPLELGLQAVVADPTNPFGFKISAATRLRSTSAQVTPVNFSMDDESLTVPLVTTTVAFAGQSWSQIEISSNGVVSFGAGVSAPQGSAAAFTQGAPKVALAWRDLAPTAGGAVTVFEDPGGRVVVDYFNVPVLDGDPGNRLTGSIVFEPTGLVWLRVDEGAGGAQITGFASQPGAAPLPQVNLSTDLPSTTQDPVFECFGASHPYDLVGETLWASPAPSGTSMTVAVSAVPFRITTILPPTGPTVGVAGMMIRGTGFDSATQVFVGGAPAVTTDLISADEIVIRTPAGTLGPADVQIVSGQGETFTAPAAYTYIPWTTTFGAGPLAVGGATVVPFTTGFIFPLFDEWYGELWVNANGTITFGGPEATGPPTVAGFENGPPRIAPFWADWQWGPSSLVAVYLTPYFCTVGYVDVIPPGGGAPFSFQVVLSHHGEVFYDFTFAPPANIDLFVGVTPGGGISTAPPVDLSQTTAPTAPFANVYEVFGASQPFDMTGMFLDVQPTQVVAPYFSLTLHP